jgi:hypothetical protein
MLDQMIYLIYWYGSKSDGDFYGFVSKSNFYTYKQEAAKVQKVYMCYQPNYKKR